MVSGTSPTLWNQLLTTADPGPSCASPPLGSTFLRCAPCRVASRNVSLIAVHSHP